MLRSFPDAGDLEYRSSVWLIHREVMTGAGNSPVTQRSLADTVFIMIRDSLLNLHQSSGHKKKYRREPRQGPIGWALRD